MSGILFDRLEVQPSCLQVRASVDGTSHDLWFEFSTDLELSFTSVALALSTLCGQAYDRVHFDFPVSDSIDDYLSQVTKAEVTKRCRESTTEPPRQGTLLSFSGGFDSLAARALMPDDSELVSMDFGGRFARERLFFDRFHPLRISTNLTATPLRANSWSFMGIGAIFAASLYRAEYLTFGGILEAGTANMRVSPKSAHPTIFPAFRAAGYTSAPFVLGLTEVGTLRILLQAYPDLVASSLTSLASPGEEKLYRKATLTRLVADSMGLAVSFGAIPQPSRPHFTFGQNFALDLLALYAISRSADPSALGLVRGVPPTLVEVSKTLDMTFMERANPTLFEHFPTQLLAGLYQRLGEFEIRWYTEQDWENFRTVRLLLGPYHNV